MPAPRYTLATAVLSAILICSPSFAKGRECIDWPKLMSRYRAADLPQAPSVSVKAFSNYTGKPGDGWLSFGISDLISDMLSSGRSLRSPSGPAAAGGEAPDLLVTGLYQHANGKLRIFVSVSDGKSGKLAEQIEASFPYPGSGDFFTEIAKIAERIMKVAKAKKDSAALAAVRDATSSVRAYESFARGRQAMWAYTSAKAEVAEAFFAEAKRLDYRSPLGYLGMSDIKSFLGFYHRQRKEPFAHFYQEAEAELALMKKLAKAKSPPAMFDSAVSGAKGGRLYNRFLAGHAYCSEARQLELAGNVPEAIGALKKALDAVPEDAMSWYHLSRLEAASGNTAASTAALRRAYSINPCIER